MKNNPHDYTQLSGKGVFIIVAALILLFLFCGGAGYLKG